MYFDLCYVVLAVFRTTLLKLVQNEGEAGLKKFAARHKRESRSNPTHCLRLNKCVYGNPSAGHEFEMLIRSAHLKGAGMTQTQVEPSIYLKILVDDEDVVHALDNLIKFLSDDPSADDSSYVKQVQSAFPD